LRLLLLTPAGLSHHDTQGVDDVDGVADHKG